MGSSRWKGSLGEGIAYISDKWDMFAYADTCDPEISDGVKGREEGEEK